MTHGQFLSKSSSNLRFFIQDSRVRGHGVGVVEGLKPHSLFDQAPPLASIILKRANLIISKFTFLNSVDNSDGFAL